MTKKLNIPAGTYAEPRRMNKSTDTSRVLRVEVVND